MNNLLAPAYCHEHTKTDLSPACTCRPSFTTPAEQWGHQMAVEA